MSEQLTRKEIELMALLYPFLNHRVGCNNIDSDKREGDDCLCGVRELKKMIKQKFGKGA